MSAFTFQIDVSRTYRNKEGYQAGGYKLNTSFKTESHTPETFINSVVRPGWPYTMVFNHDRSPQETGAAVRGVVTPKHTENFISRQELTGDDDSQAAGVIAFWLNDPFFSRYGYAFVESVNSRPEAEKGHPTLIFDRPIACPKVYKEFAKALAWKYPRLDQGIHNVDRTIYNAQGARVHLVGNVCPVEVFEAEVLNPYRKHLAQQAAIESEYQRQRQVEIERARGEGRTRNDAGSLERYLQATLDGIFDFVAQQRDNRHGAILWAGRKIGELESAVWAAPHWRLFADVEARITQAGAVNGYTGHLNGGEAEILRTFADGHRRGASQPAAEPELYERPKPTQPAQPGPKALQELEQIAAAIREEQPQQAQLSQELNQASQRFKAGFDDLRTFKGGRLFPAYAPQDDIFETPQEAMQFEYYQREIVPARKAARGARAWRDHVTVYHPELDPEEEYKRKRAEDKERGMRDCRRPIHRRGIDGKWRTLHMMCGICPDCQKQIRDNLRERLTEITAEAPDQCLTLVIANTPKERAQVVRKAKELVKDNYKSLPVEGGVYHILLPGFFEKVGDKEGQMLDIVDITDGLMGKWMNPPEGQRSRGKLFPNFRELLNKHTPDDELEIDRAAVYVQLEKLGQVKRVSLDQAAYYKDNGWKEISKRIDRAKVERLAGLPEDPQAIGFELFGISIDDKLPPAAAAVEEEVTSADQLQQVHNDTHKLIVADLQKRGVSLCIVEFQKFYALTDIPELCHRFNETNGEILAKLKAKTPA